MNHSTFIYQMICSYGVVVMPWFVHVLSATTTQLDCSSTLLSCNYCCAERSGRTRYLIIVERKRKYCFSPWLTHHILSNISTISKITRPGHDLVRHLLRLQPRPRPLLLHLFMILVSHGTSVSKKKYSPVIYTCPSHFLHDEYTAVVSTQATTCVCLVCNGRERCS